MALSPRMDTFSPFSDSEREGCFPLARAKTQKFAVVTSSLQIMPSGVNLGVSGLFRNHSCMKLHCDQRPETIQRQTSNP